MKNRYAVIDLGTNTFHLLIIEVNKGSIHQLYKERIYVKLAEEGIEKIGEKPFSRGINALKVFNQKLKQFNINEKHLKAFGTAALRTASNGSQFVQNVKDELGIQIERIEGKEEARLIHKGVMNAIKIQEERIIIMDIGGGSVEFIIADKNKVFWSESFQLGVAVLYKNFHQNDPITSSEIKELKLHLDAVVEELKTALKKWPVDILVGASGTFDVLSNVLEHKEQTEFSTKMDASLFQPFYDELIFKTLAERNNIKNIPQTRADMIVVALVLLEYIIQLTEVNEIIVSSFAMKEGILEEMIKGKLN